LQQNVREIAFRVNDQRGDPIDRGFFQQTDAQTGLSASGHSNANRVSR
jgi:hypothetical protein